MRVCVAVVTLVSVWVFGTADAFGIRIRRAQFSASLAGTYTTSAAITESQCGTSGPNGELTNTPPVKGTATERVSFSSARRTRLTVEEFDSPPLAGGGRMSIRVRATRASDL